MVSFCLLIPCRVWCFAPVIWQTRPLHLRKYLDTSRGPAHHVASDRIGFHFRSMYSRQENSMDWKAQLLHGLPSSTFHHSGSSGRAPSHIRPWSWETMRSGWGMHEIPRVMFMSVCSVFALWPRHRSSERPGNFQSQDLCGFSKKTGVLHFMHSWISSMQAVAESLP